MPHEITKIEPAYSGWSSILVAAVRLPDGHVVKREIEDHGDAAAVLPYDPERRTAMVIRQFRLPPFHVAGEEHLLEVAAGILDEDDPAACARREAMEELGLRLGALEHVVTAWTMAGISTERGHLYLALYKAEDRVGPGGGLTDEHEHIEVAELSLSELARMLDAGQITDMKLFALTQTLRVRRPELFVR